MPLMVGEIPANRLRSNTVLLAISSSWICSLAIICGTPYLISPVYANLGTKVGFIFGAVTIPVVIFCYFYLPETKDRTLEEIDEMFLNVSYPKFMGESSLLIVRRIYRVESLRSMYVLVKHITCPQMKF